MVWDDTKRLAFLENMVNTQIIPQLEQIKNATPEAPASEEAPFPTEPQDGIAVEDIDF